MINGVKSFRDSNVYKIDLWRPSKIDVFKRYPYIVKRAIVHEISKIRMAISGQWYNYRKGTTSINIVLNLDCATHAMHNFP